MGNPRHARQLHRTSDAAAAPPPPAAPWPGARSARARRSHALTSSSRRSAPSLKAYAGARAAAAPRSNTTSAAGVQAACQTLTIPYGQHLPACAPVRPMHQSCLRLQAARAHLAAGAAGRPRPSAARRTACRHASARAAAVAWQPRAGPGAPEACCRPSARGSAERRESGARRKRVPWCACASAARCSSICSPSCARRARGRRHTYEPCPSACAALQALGRRAALRLSGAGVHQVQSACSSARTNAPCMQPKQGLPAATARAPRAHSPGAAAWRAAGGAPACRG